MHGLCVHGCGAGTGAELLEPPPGVGALQFHWHVPNHVMPPSVHSEARAMALHWEASALDVAVGVQQGVVALPYVALRLVEL